MVDLCRAEHSEEKKLSTSLVEFKSRMKWTLLPLSGYEQLASQMGFTSVACHDWSRQVAQSLAEEAVTIEGMKEQILEEYGAEIFTDTVVEWENMRKWLCEGDLRVYALAARKPGTPT